VISSDSIRKGAWLSSAHIEELIRKNYPKDIIVSATFLGISNAGQFVYECGYPDVLRPQRQGLSRCKVFVYENSKGELVAEY